MSKVHQALEEKGYMQVKNEVHAKKRDLLFLFACPPKAYKRERKANC